MKIKLLTAVVGATLVTGSLATQPAFAAAEVYGLVDVAVQSVNPGAGYDGSKLFEHDAGGSGGSLLGFRGSDDLGGGMKGLAVAELGMNPDTGALDNALNKVFQRQIYAGVSGGFGTITGGRQYTEEFLTQNLGAYISTAGNIGVYFLSPAVAGVRADNTVKYVSPNLAGVNVALNYGLGEGTTAATKDNKLTELSAKYIAGPVKAGVSYSKTTVGTLDSKELAVAGQFAFGPATIYAQYRPQKDNAALAKDVKVYTVGGKFTVGAGDIVVELGQVKKGADATAANKSTLAAVGYFHNLSKTTTAYVSYGMLSNDANASRSLARQAVATTAADQDPKALIVGVKVAF